MQREQNYIKKINNQATWFLCKQTKFISVYKFYEFITEYLMHILECNQILYLK